MDFFGFFCLEKGKCQTKNHHPQPQSLCKLFRKIREILLTILLQNICKVNDIYCPFLICHSVTPHSHCQRLAPRLGQETSVVYGIICELVLMPTMSFICWKLDGLRIWVRKWDCNQQGTRVSNNICMWSLQSLSNQANSL